MAANGNENRVVGELIGFSKTIVAIVSVLSGIWFIGQPLVDDYIDEHIQKNNEIKKQEWSKKDKLRDQLSEKMGCAPDEVYIELGRMYKAEPDKFESINKQYNDIWKAIEYDLQFNKQQRNKIIQEIKFLIPETTLKIEQ